MNGLEQKIKELSVLSAARPAIDRGQLLQLAHDLPMAWNAPSTDTRLAVATPRCAWRGSKPADIQAKSRRRQSKHSESWANIWPDRELAVSLNRMHCKTGDGESWTIVRVRGMRHRLGIPEYDATKVDVPMISLMKAAEKLGICVGSANSLVQRGIPSGTQILPRSPWMVPVEALTSEAVRTGGQGVVDRHPKCYEDYQYDKVVRLPGI